MNFYPDPSQTTPEPHSTEEPEYHEYLSASPQPHEGVYPPPPSLPPAPSTMLNMAVPPTWEQPYAYRPAGQPFLPPQPMPASPVAKPNSRRWIILLGSIGLAILALGGILIYAISQVSGHNSNVAITSTTSGTSQPGTVNLGQSITVAGLTCIATSVDPLTGDTTTHPDAGNKYLVVHIQLQNNLNTTQLYNSFDFHVFNGDNQERDVEIITPDTYTADQQLIEGELSPGDSIQGDLIIQVPINDHNAKLAWSPSNVSPDSAYEWNLGQ